jgi:hypothetical protein
MKGYGSLAAAMAAPPATTNYAVVIDDTGVKPVSSEIMDVSVYKNEYMLGINTNEVMFDWTGEWIGKMYTTDPVGYRLVLYTDYDGGWTAESNQSWLQIRAGASGSPGSSASSSGKTSGPSENLEISADENKGGKEREGKITLTAGLLTKEITVRQSGGANSIIVRAGQTLRIPLAFVDEAREALDLPHWNTLSGVRNVSVAWSNTSALTPSIIGNEITASVGSGSGVGNALVVLTVGTDTVWSWHVWVVASNDNINASYHSMNTTSVFMKSLLGSGQVYYQWGRKDPFPTFNGGVHSVPVPNPVPLPSAHMIEEAIRHPSTFYLGSFPDFNWAGHTYSEYNHNNMWNETDGTKTYSDPCPVGWRVPHYQAAQTTPWQNEKPGPPFTATGYIAFDDGTVQSSTEGLIWSATAAASPHQIFYADVSATAVNPFASTYRGNGYAVRCVKDISRKY